MTITAENLHELRAIQEHSGIRAVLIHLNSLTDHRFTALYRFDDDSLHNLFFFDRQQPEIVSCPEIPVLASYCVFVRSSRQTFVTPDSLADERVLGHAKRMEVRSYCGVPLVDDDGHMFGTICHFDYQPLRISDDSVALMEAVAPLLKRNLDRTRRPNELPAGALREPSRDGLGRSFSRFMPAKIANHQLPATSPDLPERSRD